MDFLGGFLSKCGEDDPAEAAWQHLESDSHTARAAVRHGIRQFNSANPNEKKMSYGQTLAFTRDFTATCRAAGREAVLQEISAETDADTLVEVQISNLI